MSGGLSPFMKYFVNDHEFLYQIPNRNPRKNLER
jgi:hypothetical protein